MAFVPASGVTEGQIADAAQLSSLADEAPEGRSSRGSSCARKHSLRGRDVAARDAKFIPFSAYTKMSSMDIEGRQLRKGATDAIVAFIKERGWRIPQEVTELSTGSASAVLRSRLPNGSKLLGIIHLKDIVKVGMKRVTAPRDGYPLGDGHRRQPADRGGDRFEAGVDGQTSSRKRRRKTD